MFPSVHGVGTYYRDQGRNVTIGYDEQAMVSKVCFPSVHVVGSFFVTKNGLNNTHLTLVAPLTLLVRALIQEMFVVDRPVLQKS